MILSAEIKLPDGKPVTEIPLPPKEFKTGSRGFWGGAKIDIEGKRYQVQIQLVEIGSKPQPTSED